MRHAKSCSKRDSLEAVVRLRIAGLEPANEMDIGTKIDKQCNEEKFSGLEES